MIDYILSASARLPWLTSSKGEARDNALVGGGVFADCSQRAQTRTYHWILGGQDRVPLLAYLGTYIGTTSLCGKLQDRVTQPASTVNT